VIVRALAAALLLVLAGPSPETAAQDWRQSSLATFDEVWQTIADTFYDPAFAGLDWPAVRAELRPRVQAAASPAAAREITTAMLARLKRSHFMLLSAASVGDDAPLGEATVAIDVRPTSAGIAITRVEPGSAASRAGLTAGMMLLDIDATPVSSWKSAGAGADARLRTFEIWRRAYRRLRGAAGSQARLRVRAPNGQIRQFVVAREPDRGEIVTLGNLPPWPVRTDVREVASSKKRRVGVIAFNVWMPAIDRPVADAVDRFRGADGLVIDLRGNPGGLALMISGIAGHLMDDADTLLGRMQTRQGQLEFHPNPRRSTPDGRAVQPYGGPVALLVDELTASASECFAGALQSLGRARVFGRPTVGEALPALTKQLPNGDVLMYAIGDFVTATGRSMEGAGVVPDQVVPLSIRALAAGRDDDLQAALRWIDALK
jgi:carboxyl-terminal processing protease